MLGIAAPPVRQARKSSNNPHSFGISAAARLLCSTPLSRDWPDAGLTGFREASRSGCARYCGAARRHPVRLARLQTAIWTDVAAHSRGQRPLEMFCRRRNRHPADRRHHADVRRHRLAGLCPGFRIHPQRRARTGQYRLVQDPKRVFPDAHVGRAGSAGLCAAGHRHRRGRRGCGGAPLFFRSRRRRCASAPSWRRRTASTTT